MCVLFFFFFFGGEGGGGGGLLDFHGLKMSNWFFIGGHHQRTSKPNPITTTKKGKKTFKELPKPKPHPLVAISDIVQSKIESISNLTPTKFKLIIPEGGAIINEQKTIREKEKH